jgi:hypothetical protein
MIRIIYLFTILILYCLCSFVAAQSKGGRWQFENNGNDTAGWDEFQDNGTLQNQAFYSSASPVKEGTSYLWLDTAYTYNFFKVDDSNDLDFDNENIGISSWIYPTVINDIHFILNKGVQNTNPKTTNYAMRISLSGNLEFLIRDANNKAQTATSDFIISANHWTFVAIYYDYQAMKVYMWNEPSISATDTVEFNKNLLPNDDPLVIGSWFREDSLQPSIKDFKGAIDDVRISGRVEDIIPNATTIASIMRNNNSDDDIEFKVFPNPVDISGKDALLTLELNNQGREQIEVNIYNVLGQVIYTYMLTGLSDNYTFSWDLRNSTGYFVPSGIYFVRIKGAHTQLIRKFIVAR